MPGFTSFLVGRGHFSSYRPDSPSPPESDSEPEVVRKAMRRTEKQQARKVTTLYDTTMSRPSVERSHEAMKKLQAEIQIQIERFHDAGLASGKERQGLLDAFAENNATILRGCWDMLRRLEVTSGPVEDLQEGLRVLGQLMGEQEGEMDLAAAEQIFMVYRNEVGKPLSDMSRKFGRALEDRRVWR